MSTPEPGRDWAEDAAHDRLVEETHTHLRAAQTAALAAEQATVQYGYVVLIRDLADGEGSA